MNTPSAMSLSKRLWALAGWLALVFSAALTGAFVSTKGWYEALAKPAWNPPNWIFGPVWTALYVLMAVAAWRVWRRGGWREQQRPLQLFLAQWALNALWTPLFFGLQRPDWALAGIVLLLAFLAATVHAFSKVDKVAALLLTPYLGWVAFAAVLNATIWHLNR